MANKFTGESPMLSPELEVTLNLAISEAKRRGHEYVTVEHILYALMHDPSSSDAIIQCGGDVEAVKLDIEEFFDDQLAKVNLAKSKIPQPTLGFQRVIQRAAHHVSASGNEAIMGSHVLVSIFSEEESFAAYFLSRQQISRLDVIQQFSYSFDSDDDQSLVQTDYTEVESDEDDEKKSTSASKRDPLNQFAVNLCARAKKGKIDPLIGRETEVERAMQILCRRRKNNPLFVGDAGTGKTAIAEGLALRIVENKVPPLLQGAEIFALDIGALLAGSKFRGDFEQRLKGVLKSLKNHEKGILFIDEIHTLIGAGSVGGGAMDASNLLKPSLASGELRCMGSTTFKEFRNSIEGDHALYRRFQKIDVAEPTVGETIKILKGLKSRYEDYHKVTYSAGAIRAAAELSARYITDKKLPDKAIDVIDEVAAALNLKGDKIKKRKISHEMVQSVVAKMARIPPQKVSSGDKQYLKTLELDLKQKIFGQDRAIEALATAIKMSRSGLTEEDKPIGSFLFTGPTGVGKTELSRQLAKQMGIELLRFDMSEYMEKHSVSRLIGAPPGYVGFDQGGQLTDAVNKNPHVVLLLDEIEKAHPDIQGILLQVMDHGSLTDNNGRTTDFRNVVLVMTSNAGAHELSRSAIGFSRSVNAEEEKGLSQAVKNSFSPEFRNRLNSIIQFAPLTEEVVKRVALKFFGELNTLLKAKSVTIEPDDDALTWVARQGYEPAYGARPIKRLLEDKIKKPLADELLFGELSKGGVVKVRVMGNELTFVFSKD